MKTLQWLIFAGLLAVGMVTACDQDAAGQASQCLANVDISKVNSLHFGGIGDMPTKKELQAACDVLKKLMPCVEQALNGCPASYMEDYEQYENMLREQCSDVFFCYSEIQDCVDKTPDFLQTVQGDPEPNSTVCSKVLPFTACLKDRLQWSPECRAVPEVRSVEVKPLEFECHRTQCSAMQKCQATAQQAFDTQPQSGLNSAQCNTLKRYVSCAHNAVSTCSYKMRPPHGQPSASVVASFLGQACDKLDTASGLYSCAEFTSCFDDLLEILNPLSPGHFCDTLQSVLGCAVENAATCTVPNSDTFIKDLNELMLDIADRGCAKPQFRLDSCTGLQTCMQTAVGSLGQSSTFDQSCTAFATFQACADNALTSCNIQQPSRSPRLSKLATITTDMCTALSGQTITGCQNFTECMDASISFPDGGEMTSSRVWCSVATSLLQCAENYGPFCSLSEETEAELKSLYKEYVSAGCPDPYQQASGAAKQGSSLLHVVLTSLAVFRLLFV